MPCTLLFDLDGTLTDPKPGITRCIQHALTQLGHTPPPMEELLWCIGPPLEQSFATLLQTSEPATIGQAVKFYRDRFSSVGLFENALYPGIPALLQTLKQAGYPTLVATSKPQIFAAKIVDHFEISPWLDRVYGSELDGSRSDKGVLIDHILRSEGLVPETTVMIGDRKHDMIGGKKNGLRTIGVTYGYGSAAELTEHGADYLAHRIDEIFSIVTRL